jgi:hypothetical protein
VNEVSTGTLREIVKDQEALGLRTIEVPKLLQRLHLDDALEGMRASVVATKLPLAQGDTQRAAAILELVEQQLVQLLGH